MNDMAVKQLSRGDSPAKKQVKVTRSTGLSMGEASALLAAMRNLPVPIITVDAESLVTTWNPAATEMFGYNDDEALGRSIYNLIVPDTEPVNPNAFAKCLRDKKIAPRRIRQNMNRDGRRIDCEWSQSLLYDELGDINGLLLVAHDISKFHQTETQLNRSLAGMRLASDITHMGAWNWDLRTNQFSLSESMGPLHGLPPGQGPANPDELLAMVHPEDRCALQKALSDDTISGKSIIREFRVLWPDESIHWIEAHSNFMLDANGKPEYGIGVAIDVTQRKRDAHAMVRSNRALKTLIAVNEELVRAGDETALLQAICKVIVEHGGYRMAAIGFSQHDIDMSIDFVAWSGAENGYFSATKHTWADTADGQRPISRAIRSGNAELSRNIGGDVDFQSVRNEALARSYASTLALPLRLNSEVIGTLSIYASECGAFDADEIDLLEKLARDISFGIDAIRTRQERDRNSIQHLQAVEQLKISLEDSIQAVAATLEMRDPYTAGHERRVAALAVAFAREMGLEEEKIHGLHLAAVVHDLGKIGIPAEILSKPGRLTPIEFALIKTHPQIGYDILKDIKYPWPIATIVHQHHERLDGTGYPLGLKGDEILIESRILAVADVVEAMAAHRPYRASLGVAPALAEIVRGRGTIYDPAAVDACLKLYRENKLDLPGVAK